MPLLFDSSTPPLLTMSDSDGPALGDVKLQEQRYLRARKCHIWANICMALGIITIFAGGLLLVIAAVFLYRKRKKILAEGPVVEVKFSPEEISRRNKIIAAYSVAGLVLFSFMVSAGSVGKPLSPSSIDEKSLRGKLTGTFYDRGQRIKNPLYGSINGQIEHQDFSNYTFYVSLSPDGSAMIIVESKEGDYGGVHLPGGVSMKNTTYELGKSFIKSDGKEVEAWTISFSETPAAFPEDELLVCDKGFKSIKDVYGKFQFTKKDGKVLRSRNEVAKYFKISSS
jgi:hypothetical protein